MSSYIDEALEHLASVDDAEVVVWAPGPQQAATMFEALAATARERYEQLRERGGPRELHRPATARQDGGRLRVIARGSGSNRDVWLGGRSTLELEPYPRFVNRSTPYVEPDRGGPRAMGGSSSTDTQRPHCGKKPFKFLLAFFAGVAEALARHRAEPIADPSRPPAGDPSRQALRDGSALPYDTRPLSESHAPALRDPLILTVHSVPLSPAALELQERAQAAFDAALEPLTSAAQPRPQATQEDPPMPVNPSDIDPADRNERELERAAPTSDLVDERSAPLPPLDADDELERLRELDEDRAREELELQPPADVDEPDASRVDAGPITPAAHDEFGYELPADTPARHLRELAKGELGAALEETQSAAEAMVFAARAGAALERAVAELIATARDDVGHGDLHIRNLVAVGAPELKRLRELVAAWTASECVVVRVGKLEGAGVDDYSASLAGLPGNQRRLWARVRSGLAFGDVVRLPRALGERLVTLRAATLEEG
jgi:hypothetical protein